MQKRRNCGARIGEVACNKTYPVHTDRQTDRLTDAHVINVHDHRYLDIF